MGGQISEIRVSVEAHPHFVVARRLWDAIALGDAAALRLLLSEKSLWKLCGNSPLAGSYLGIDAILDFLARVGELTDDLRSDLLEIFVGDRGGVIRYRVQAVRGTQQLDTEHLFRFRVKEGRIVEAVFAPIDQYGYDEFFVLQ
jgi:ketosteroid isomerase-like protein